MNSANRNRRMAKFVSRFVLVVAMICLVVAALPADGFKVMAATEKVQVASINQWNEAMDAAAHGSTLNMVLYADIFENVNETDGTFPLIIKEGVTVNLYMAGHEIRQKLVNRDQSESTEKDRANYADFEKVLIDNNGSLTIYPGDISNPNNGTAKIYLENSRKDMKAYDRNEESTANLICIRNSNNLTVQGGVTINCIALFEYTSADRLNGDSAYSSVLAMATGIYNTADTAVCVVDDITVDVSATAIGCSYDYNVPQADYAFARCILGGKVTVNGSSNLTSFAKSHYNNNQDLAYAGLEALYSVTESYCIASAGGVTVHGGSFTAKGELSSEHNKANGNKATVNISPIAYTKTSEPVITDGNFNVSYKLDNATCGNGVYQFGVAKTTNDFALPSTENPGNGDAGYNGFYNPLTSGTYRDENNFAYEPGATNSSGGNTVMVIQRGAVKKTAADNYARIHLVYRFWEDSTKKTLLSYSLAGAQDDRILKKADMFINNVHVDNDYSMKHGSAANPQTMTLRVYESANPNYWERLKPAFDVGAATNVWYGDYQNNSFASAGTANFSVVTNDSIEYGGKTVQYTEYTYNFTGVNNVFIYVDYIRVAPTPVQATFGSAKTVEVAYSGSQPIPNKTEGFNVKIIKSGNAGVDWTADYNLANTNNTDLVPVSYYYVNKNNSLDTGNTLPVNAGSYTVTYTLAADTDIKRPNSKNSRELTGEFTLIIKKAYVERGNLAESLTLTYGEKLVDKLKLEGLQASGVNNEKPDGTFKFSNGAADSDAFKNVCTNNILHITWSPAANTVAGNYQQTTFTVNYTVNPADLTIEPTDAAVVYGNSEFAFPYSAVINGLVANDNTEAKKTDILNALAYTIKNADNEYNPYVAGTTDAGSYNIQPKLASVPGFLSNYNVIYNYGENYGQLLVNRRPLTVLAEAQSRDYDPDDMTATVLLNITDGILEGDTVTINPVKGDVEDNIVGKHAVKNITKELATAALGGADYQNYTVAVLNCADGQAEPVVEIVKAVPEIELPVVGEARQYTAGGKLSHINLNAGYTPAIKGTWKWNDGDTNPQVLVKKYAATFTPDDIHNYQTITADIPVEILPTDVIVTFNANVTYGDPRPNLTQYVYTCTADPDFDITSVATTGNIYPSTEYDQFDGVLEGGYVVILNDSDYRDTKGNYNLIIKDGVINVAPRQITVTADDAVVKYGEFFDIMVGRTVSYSDSFAGSDTPNSLTKNGTAPQYTFTTLYDYENNHDVGTYSIKVSMNEDDISPNYDITFVSGTLTVQKADLVFAGKTVYTDYLQAADLYSAFDLNGLAHGDTLDDATDGTLKVYTDYTANSPVTAEGYTYYFDLSGITSANYNVSSAAGKVYVRKINPVINQWPTASAPFGTPLSQAVFTDYQATVKGMFAFDAADATPLYSTTPYNKDTLVYAATFIPEDTVNYNVLGNLVIPLTITKGMVSGELFITGFPMAGQELSADLSSMTPADEKYYSFVWTVDDVEVSNAKTYTVAEEDKDKEVKLTVHAVEPYEGTANKTIVVSQRLTKPADDLSDILTIAGFEEKTYNANAQGVSVDNLNPAEILMGAITVRYNGSTLLPKDAGVYNVTVDIALPENVNGVTGSAETQTMIGSQKIYAPVSNVSIGTLTIKPAAFNVNVTVAEKEYDGTNIAVAEQTAIVNGALAYDDVQFDVDSVSYLFDTADVGTGKNIRVGGADLTGAAKDNYALHISIVNENDGVITPKTLNAAIVALSREYEEGNKTVDIAFDIDLSTLAQGDTDADVYFNNTTATIASDKAGEQTVNVADGSIVLAGAKAGNYRFHITNLNNVTVEIEKATPDYPMPAVGILTYDSGRTLDDVSLGDSRWAWVNGSVIPSAGTATYTAIFTPDDNGVNYKTIEKDVTIVVNKAPIVVTATNYTLTYGDAAPTYSYTVTGLTGADTLESVATGYAVANCAYYVGAPVRAEGYPVVVTGYYSSANYEFRYVQGLVTVNARPLYVTATATDRNYVASNYDVTINFSQPTNVYASDNVALVSYAVTGTVENNAAGKRAVKYTAPALTGAAASNYVLVVNPSDLTVEITKTQPLNVVMPTSATVIYGNTLSSAVFTSAKEGDGIFRLENATSYPAAHGIFSDVYKVEFIPTDAANYATLSAYITLTVEKRPLAISASINGSCTEGETLYIITSAIDNAAAPHIIYEWYRLNNAGDRIQTGVKLAEGLSYTLTDKDVGYYIACAVTVNNAAPYICDTIAVTDSSIEEVHRTIWQKIWAWFYNIFASIFQLFGSMTG